MGEVFFWARYPCTRFLMGEVPLYSPISFTPWVVVDGTAMNSSELVAPRPSCAFSYERGSPVCGDFVKMSSGGKAAASTLTPEP